MAKAVKATKTKLIPVEGKDGVEFIQRPWADGTVETTTKRIQFELDRHTIEEQGVILEKLIRARMKKL